MREDNPRLQQLFFSLSKGGVDLESAIRGFLLSLELENRTEKTLDYNRGNLSRFLWYAKENAFPSALAEINAGHVKMFLT